MIVVTTPTGAIGHQVLDTLLDAGAPIRVIARDPARLPPHAHGRVEIVEGSHGDAATVDRAFDGADAVFWLRPPDFRAADVDAAYLDFTRPACDAIRRFGVGRVVGVSALGRGVPGPAGLVSAALRMDDLIAETGVAYRALAMPSFMDNMLRQVEPIRDQGVFFSTLSGDRRAPTCATCDIAAVAARLLLDRAWTGRADVPVLGPEDLSQDDLAAIMSEVLGKPVRYQQISLEAYKAQLLARGASEAMAQGMIEMMAAKERGLDNAVPRTPEGTTPTSFRQWCAEVLKPALRA
jgi:uncharacterized protein YbjT (DUF2867 family)